MGEKEERGKEVRIFEKNCPMSYLPNISRLFRCVQILITFTFSFQNAQAQDYALANEEIKIKVNFCKTNGDSILVKAIMQCVADDTISLVSNPGNFIFYYAANAYLDVCFGLDLNADDDLDTEMMHLAPKDSLTMQRAFPAVDSIYLRVSFCYHKKKIIIPENAFYSAGGLYLLGAIWQEQTIYWYWLSNLSVCD